VRTLIALRQRIGWLALAVLVFGAMAPTVSRLHATQLDDGWVEICTARGMEWVQIGPSSSSAPTKSAASMDHCGYCLLQAHSPALPTAETNWRPNLRQGHLLPSGSGASAVLASAVRRAHQPRAPPASA